MIKITYKYFLLILIPFLAFSDIDQKPNIILIFVDDMGYGDASCYGGDLVKTPNIDYLANFGLRFSQGYSISSVCGPSRVGLMTGTSPARFGVYWNPDMGAVKIPKERPIIPIQLKKAGYKTCIVGKWNLNNPSWDPMPADLYFDHTSYTMVWEGDYWPDKNGNYHGVNDKNYGSSKTYGEWGPKREKDEYLTDALTKSACEFIVKEANNPFFLYLAYNAPHTPLQGKKDHLYELNYIDNEPLKLYASMLKSVDEGVGEILKSLRSKNIEKNTLIIFLSDNGPARTNYLKGYPEDWPKLLLTSNNNQGLRGRKGQFFEGGIKIPFIAYWPSVIEANSLNHQPVYSLDLYPTFSSIAKIPLSDDQIYEGQTLYPLFKNNSHLIDRKSMIWVGDNKKNKIGAIRIGDWKLVLDKNENNYLFDLKNDPLEKSNLIQENTTMRNKLLEVFNKYLDDLPSPVTKRK